MRFGRLIFCENGEKNAGISKEDHKDKVITACVILQAALVFLFAAK